MIRLTPNLLAPAAAGLALAGSPAFAQANAAQGELGLLVSIVNGCTLTTTPIAFGPIIGAGRTVRSTGSVNVACTANLDYSISIDQGRNGSTVVRRLRNSQENSFMRYDLYSDPGYSRPWTAQHAGKVVGNSGWRGTVTYSVYGELTVDPAARAGNYDDTVTVTIDF